MSNIQHSSRHDSWRSPSYIIDKVRTLFDGEIDLDVASSEMANQDIKARRILTVQDDALKHYWNAKNIYCNPPGGKTGNKSNTVLFWKHLMDHLPCFGHAVFMAFSLEALATTQSCNKSMLDFPFIVPRKRIAFIHPCLPDKLQPTHANVIIYVPSSIDKTKEFLELFSDLGKGVDPRC